MWKGQTILVAWLLPLLLAGCISNPIRDVELVSLDPVDYYDQGEIPSPSAAGFTQFLTDAEILRYGLGKPYEDRPHRLLLKAQFSSKTDLARFVAEQDYNLGAHAFFCERPNDQVFLSFVDVYWQSMPVYGREGLQIPEHGAEPIIYYFFLGVSPPRGAPKEVSYDLRQRAQDVCFYLAGGSGPFGFKSNVATIASHAIQTALQAIPFGVATQ